MHKFPVLSGKTRDGGQVLLRILCEYYTSIIRHADSGRTERVNGFVGTKNPLQLQLELPCRTPSLCKRTALP